MAPDHIYGAGETQWKFLTAWLKVEVAAVELAAIE